MLTAGLQSLPVEIYEAAKVDGASYLQTIRYLTIPLLKRVTITALIFRTTDCFLAFDIIYMITQGGPGTATTTLYIYNYLKAFQWLYLGYAAAISVVMAILILGFSGLFSKITRTPLTEIQ